jgi:hypothetical protein
MQEQGPGALSDCQAPNPEKDFNFWQYDPDPNMMGNPPGARIIGEAATRRINYVFNNWQSGSTKGILIWLNIKDNKITEISSETTDAHPDVGFEQPHFRVDVLSEESRVLKSIDLWDPRIQLGEDFVYSDDVNFPVRFPWYKNLRKVSITDKSTDEVMITVDLTDTINDFCIDNSDDPDCEGGQSEEKSSAFTSSSTTSTIVVKPLSTTTLNPSITATTVEVTPVPTDAVPISEGTTINTTYLLIGVILILLLAIVYLVGRSKGQA